MDRKAQTVGIVVLVFAAGTFARAGTFSGTVVDPQRRVIVGARVSLACGKRLETQNTDELGNFTFIEEALRTGCKIRATHPGFAPLELPVRQGQTLTLQLHLLEVRQTVSVRSDLLSPVSLASVSLSASELRAVSSNSNDLVAYAKLLAGAQSDSDHVYVDGLPADSLPPADRIERITINPDPLSSEYSDATDTHVEIVTKSDRKLRISVGGISFATRAHDPLDSRFTSALRTASVGLAVPVPGLPLVFTTDVRFSERQKEQPIEAVVPPLDGNPIAPVAAPVRGSNTMLGLGVDYSKTDSLRVNLSLYVLKGTDSNTNVGGLTLPQAGLSKNTMARELRLTFRKAGKNYLYRGGVSTERSDVSSLANSNTLGVSVSGAFVGGGSDVYNDKSQNTKWTLKNVLESSTRMHYWSAGLSISRSAAGQSTIPNPFGHIYFDDLPDYISSATSGALTGTALITRGQGRARYSRYAVDPFVEAEVLRGTRISVRGGLRADYQTAGSVHVSPRVSTVATFHGFVLKAGGGMFVDNWSSGIFLRVAQHDGHHLQQFVSTNASLSDLNGGTTTLTSRIVSEIASNLVPARNWVYKISVERPLGHFAPGIEYTRTEGTHLLGSERLSAPTGWTDVLESNRTLRKQQLHLRTQLSVKGQNITAHYEWIHARDNTDGPFSFPARQGDSRSEWAPAGGLSSHNLTLVGNVKFRNVISLALVGVMRSRAPLNITSGADVQGNGLYTDRAGAPRNSGRGPAYNSLDLHAHRRIALPKLFPEFKQKTYLDIGVQAENLLGNRNYVSLGTVIGSPLFGRPLAALPGRSVRFSFNFQR